MQLCSNKAFFFDNINKRLIEFLHNFKTWLTAGRAKNEIPKMAENAAMSFPAQVVGTTSPYPTVHSVICNINHLDCSHQVRYKTGMIIHIILCY